MDMVEQGIFVAVEVHNYRNYGATVRELIKIGIPIQMTIILGYCSNTGAEDISLNGRGYKRRPNEIPDSNGDGFVSEKALDELISNAKSDSALHIIINGEYYRGCHESATYSILLYQIENGIKNISYHFIADKIRRGESSQSLKQQLMDFDVKDTDHLGRDIAYRDIAREMGFTPILFIDGVHKDGEAQKEKPTVKLYYWNTSQTFKENLESLLT